MESPFLSLQDAADYLGVDYKTVYRLVRAGRLPAGKFGGMYRIRREDLDAYFQAQVNRVTGRQTPVEPSASAGPEPMPDKCSLCHRLLKSADDIGGPCADAACAQPICRACWQAGQRRCATHQPGERERLLEARAALARGEVTRLVPAVAARQLEQAWLARFDARMADIASFYHPGTGEVLRVADWEPFRSRDDETLQLMRLLNVGYLDRATLAALPHNETARFRIDPAALGRGRPARGLVIQARFVGRLEQYVAPGYDTRPADLEELLMLLGELETEAAERAATVIAGLGSPTGWDDAALAHIIDDRGRAYRHPAALPVLIDLETGAIHANTLDERLSRFGYAELFKLTLDAEEAAALAPALEAALAGREGRPLADLAAQLGRPQPLIAAAAALLAASGRFKLVDEGTLGPVLMQSRA